MRANTVLKYLRVYVYVYVYNIKCTRRIIKINPKKLEISVLSKVRGDRREESTPDRIDIMRMCGGKTGDATVSQRKQE